MKTNKLSRNLFVALSISAFAFYGCNDHEEGIKSGKIYGKEISVGDGKAKAWIEIDDLGNPSSLGVTLTENAMQNLPHDHEENAAPSSFTLQLPQEKIKTPFDHISLDWNPHGHEPEHIYNKPHFDLHFYMITESEQQAITANDPKSEEFPDSKYLPAPYVPIPGSVPQMGKHWVDPYSHEFEADGSFTQTFILGTYNKMIAFYEPMITLEYLLSKPDVTFDIPQPEAFQKPGYYPVKYVVKFDEAAKEYTISLGSFTKR